MKSLFNRLSLTALALSPATVLAHPGHGIVEGWAHFFTPDHVLPVLAIVGVLVYFVVRKRDRS
jgi:hypothetical protein